MSKALNSLLKNADVARVMDGVAAGTDDTTDSEIVDMANFEGVMFVCAIGAITATGTLDLKAQQGAAADMADAADLAGTKVSYTDADDNKLAILDIQNPGERYVRVNAVRATANVVIDGVIAIKYGARKLPRTQGATVVGSELHISPDEGTA